MAEPEGETVHYWYSADLLALRVGLDPVVRGPAGPRIAVHRVEEGAKETDCGRPLEGMAEYLDKWRGEHRCKDCWPDWS